MLASVIAVTSLSLPFIVKQYGVIMTLVVTESAVA